MSPSPTEKSATAQYIVSVTSTFPEVSWDVYLPHVSALPLGGVYSLAFDLSSTTGISLLHADTPGAPATTILAAETRTTLCGFERILRLSEIYADLVKTVRALVEASGASLRVVLEGYAHGASFNNSFQYEIGTATRMAFYNLGVSWLELPPTNLKKFLTGVGNVHKDKIMLEVYRRFGFAGDTNNMSDAYGLAVSALVASGLGPKVPAANMKALESVQSYQPLLVASGLLSADAVFSKPGRKKRAKAS